MALYVTKLDKSVLLAMPPEERMLLFGLAHIADEILAFQKLYLWSVQGPVRSGPELEGETFLSLLFVKSLAGKLFEGYDNVLRKGYFETPIQTKYRTLINKDGKRALDAIQKYFRASDNSVKITRNRFAFHYSPKKYDSVLPQLKEELKFYIQDGGSSNNLYYFAEVLANNALLQDLPGRTEKAAMKRLNAEIAKITSKFVVGCDALISALIGSKNPAIWIGNATPVRLINPIPIEQIRIPWFTETENLGKKSS